MRVEARKGIKTVVVLGNPLDIEDKTFYPVVRISTLNTKEQALIGAWASPLAMVIVEPTQEYVVPLTDESITLEQLFVELPSLKNVVRDNARAR